MDPNLILGPLQWWTPESELRHWFNFSVGRPRGFAHFDRTLWICCNALSTAGLSGPQGVGDIEVPFLFLPLALARLSARPNATYAQVYQSYAVKKKTIGDPTRLLLVDEANSQPHLLPTPARALSKLRQQNALSSDRGVLFRPTIYHFWHP